MNGRKVAVHGFSLLECLIALLLGTLVLGTLMAGLVQFQRLSQAVQNLGERDRDHQLALVLLARWVLPAGNGAGAARPMVSVGNELEVMADLEGDGGFPDGDLEDPFEKITLRVSGGSLQLRSGRGRFEPFARHIGNAAFTVEPRTLHVDLDSRLETVQLQAARLPLSSRFLFARVCEKPNLFSRKP
jgi:hypothetical protein